VRGPRGGHASLASCRRGYVCLPSGETGFPNTRRHRARTGQPERNCCSCRACDFGPYRSLREGAGLTLMACCPSVLQGQNNVVSIQFFARPQGVRSNETSITSDESLPKSELFLEASLFATNAAGTTSDAAVGQSFRRAAGGANNSAGFEGKSGFRRSGVQKT